ncbi:MAG: twin-arginine translocation signal domain-containing protein, partial [Candidatus Dadabacteria bacterium]
MTRQISRRAFLKESAAAAVTLSLIQLRFGAPKAAQAASSSSRKKGYGNWEDVYREKWTWDKVVNSTHHVANCASACPWVLYIKDGIVWREEQNGVLDSRSPDLPDYNPRGCQKGACFSQLMYGPHRLKYPVKRVGPRGSGKWKRITWDEAYEEITNKMLEVIREDGPECIIHESGTANAGYGAATSGEMSFFDYLGATQLDGWATVGDMPLGVILTWGLFNTDSTADDYVRSDLIFMWLGNPSYTRIPEAHFFWEARYRGAKVVSIAPDYNASTMHADQWINLRVGTDAALALSMAKVIIDEGLYKADYVKEQTDLPILVRDDTRKFLRASDMEKRGKDNVFYLWDSKTGKAVRAPGSEGLGRSTTLALGKLDPALEGSFEVTLADGSKVRVRPVFELLKQRLADYTPEKAEKITGVGADTIRELARETARAKAVNMYSSWGSMKHYHSDLFQRGIILLLALTGNVGYRGTGLKIGAWYMLSSIESAVSGVKPTWYQRLLLMLFKPTVREYIKYFREYEKDKMYVPALMFLYHHGGL